MPLQANRSRAWATPVAPTSVSHNLTNATNVGDKVLLTVFLPQPTYGSKLAI